MALPYFVPNLLDPILAQKLAVTPHAAIPAVAVTPGWYLLGVFVADTSGRATLQGAGCVTAGGLTLRVRLVTDTLQDVAGASVTTTAPTPTAFASGQFDVLAGATYELHAECTGGAVDSSFGVVLACKVVASG